MQKDETRIILTNERYEELLNYERLFKEKPPYFIVTDYRYFQSKNTFSFEPIEKDDVISELRGIIKDLEDREIKQSMEPSDKWYQFWK